MAKGSSKPGKVGVKKITAKQRIARIKNIAVARKARKKNVTSPEKIRGGVYTIIGGQNKLNNMLRVKDVTGKYGWVKNPFLIKNKFS